VRRTAREKRALGLFTAVCLLVFLVVLLVWVGDPALQWPVLLVPVLWAGIALRRRRGSL